MGRTSLNEIYQSIGGIGRNDKSTGWSLGGGVVALMSHEAGRLARQFSGQRHQRCLRARAAWAALTYRQTMTSVCPECLAMERPLQTPHEDGRLLLHLVLAMSQVKGQCRSNPALWVSCRSSTRQCDTRDHHAAANFVSS